MNYSYFEKIKALIGDIENTQKENIDKLIELMVKTILNKNAVFIFGASHAGILVQETYYRAGGLVCINPVFSRDLMLDVMPISFTSKMERVEGYGTEIAAKTPIKEGDLVIIHSVSGRNPVTIDFALKSKEMGGHIVCITNLTYTKQVLSKHSSGKNLFECADLVIDNCGELGDACVELPNTKQKVAPTSTMSAILIMNTVISETTIRLVELGKTAPIFYSANMDGNDDLNRKIFEEYKDIIHYNL